MSFPKQDKINEMAKVFFELRTKAENSKGKKIKKKFAEFQKECIKEFSFLVAIRVNRYRQFSNFSDLQQEGFEGLVMALKSFDPNKSTPFVWWANKYIGTKISRAANAHSTIRYPLDIAKDTKPHKVIGIPDVQDHQLYGEDSYELSEIRTKISKAVLELPPLQQKLVNLIYGLGGMKPHSIGKTIEILQLPKHQYNILLEQAKEALKVKLSEIGSIEE